MIQYSHHTSFSDLEGAWWSVDLGKEVDVASVKVMARGDCCGERLSNSDVILVNSLGYNRGCFHIGDAMTGQEFNIPAKFFTLC